MGRLVRSQAKFVRVSPTKASLVAAQVRGKEAQTALQMLRLSPKSAAKPIYKALFSAVSNAENNHKLDPKRLVIQSITTTQGPSLKRYRPRARGSAASILKRSTHITVLVEEVVPPAPKKSTAKQNSAKNLQTTQAKDSAKNMAKPNETPKTNTRTK
jgi:large subunit ribosomal protein L22